MKHLSHYLIGIPTTNNHLKNGQIYFYFTGNINGFSGCKYLVLFLRFSGDAPWEINTTLVALGSTEAPPSSTTAVLSCWVLNNHVMGLSVLWARHSVPGVAGLSVPLEQRVAAERVPPAERFLAVFGGKKEKKRWWNAISSWVCIRACVYISDTFTTGIRASAWHSGNMIGARSDDALLHSCSF